MFGGSYEPKAHNFNGSCKYDGAKYKTTKS